MPKILSGCFNRVKDSIPNITILDKLFPQWYDFQDNIKDAIENLREGNGFANVTLAWEDGQKDSESVFISSKIGPNFSLNS